jgi:thiamine kinase-like enzyme
MAHLSPDEAIHRIDAWKDKNVRWEDLGGGITNHNYLVYVSDRPGASGVVDESSVCKYVLRIPGQGTDLFIDRNNERDCMIAAAQAGVGPEVAYTIDPEGALVSTFVEGEILHPQTLAGHPDRIRQVVQTVRVVHERAAFQHEIDVFQMLRDYTNIARKIDAPVPPALESLLSLMNDVEKAMDRDRPACAACHNDLLSENFIVDASGKMWIIDWEYGGMTDPYFDLGDFCMEHPFSTEEERLVLATYCGQMDEHRYDRMQLYKIVSAVWWAVWAMIQHKVSKIQFDYVDWGMERLARAQRGVADADFARRLAEV